MAHSLSRLALAFVALTAGAQAAFLTFATNPLTNNPALTTPGRQVVPPAGQEPFLTFDPAVDTLVFDLGAFGVSQLNFANGLSTAIPTSGVNFIVLQNGAPLAAGSAADAIAAQLTQGGPGFFIYFNSGLNLPRLVFSPDLNDPTADLAVLARFTNLTGDAGRTAIASITASDAIPTPEPSSLVLTAAGAVLVAMRTWRRSSRS